MHRFAVLGLVAAGCAPLKPPQAVVSVPAPGGPPRDMLLAMPTTCVAAEDLCNVAIYYTDPAKAPKNTVDEMIDPILRFKLELAGFMVADARTLRLETADRTDDRTDDAGGAQVSETATVADLVPVDRLAAAASIGLTGILDSTLQITRDGSGYAAPIRFTLLLEMRAVPDGAIVWTTRCSELVDAFDDTARLLATCAGDGVIAWRAPDALIGQAR